MIDVVCVLWGDKFSLDYAYNLQAMVKRNTTLDHRFLCFSDRQIPNIETKILKKGYSGWWNKLQLFDKEKELNQHVVFFDLDTLIVNNIDWLLGYTGEFMGIEDVGAQDANNRIKRRKLVNVMQSGVLAFDSAKNYHVWDNFVKDNNATQKFRGDGEYLNSVIKNRDLLQYKFSNHLKSYKWHVYPNRPSSETSIVCFHGKPSIQESLTTSVRAGGQVYAPSMWVKEYWFSETDNYVRNQTVSNNTLLQFTKDKKIALVGNASSLLEKNLGTEIDSHDCVIRINKPAYFYDQAHIESVGQKTDIWAFFDKDIFEEIFNGQVEKIHNQWHQPIPKSLITYYRSRQFQLLDLALRHKRKVRGVYFNDNLELSKEKQQLIGQFKNPSAGVLLLHLLSCLKLQNVSIYGFDWKQSQTFSEKHNTKEDYLKKINGHNVDIRSKHNYTLEKEFCRELIANNNWIIK